MINAPEVVEAQAAVIAAQAHTIDELYKVLLQHVAADELDHLQSVESLHRAEANLNEAMPADGR